MRTSIRKNLTTVGLVAGFAVVGGLAHAAQRELRVNESHSSRQLVSFAVELTRWSHADAATPESLEAMIGSTSLTLVGELVTVKPGRKAFAGIGCDKQDEQSGRCLGDEKAVIYDSYANIVVKPISILRGALSAENAPVSVEVPWPNNVGLDSLRRTFPAGARVIVIGDHVRGAETAAAPLIERGLSSKADVAANLVGVAPYGFIIESSDGVVAPMWSDGPLVKDKGAHVFTSFDRAAEALRAAAPNAVEPRAPRFVPPGIFHE